MSLTLLSEQKDDPAPATNTVAGVVHSGVALYKTVAVLTLNTIILLIVINVICFFINLVHEKNKDKSEDAPTVELFTQKYHDYTEAQMKELLREKHRDRMYEFAPFIGYRYRPVWKEFLHIDPHGYRRSSNSALWPPDSKNLNVFVFGASTTYGVGIMDNETIPARMQEYLKDKCKRPVEVYNFGTAGYNSTIERVQFADILSKGIRPDVAIFIDGNLDAASFNDDPPLSGEFKEMFEDRGHGLLKSLRPFFHDLPMTKLSENFRKATQNPKHKELNLNPEQVKHIVARYLENKRLIEAQAQACNVSTLFVWQPSPDYKFDLKNHPYPPLDFSVVSRPTYEEMEKTVKASSPQFKSNFLWLADIQEQATEPCYIDNTHYRATLCKTIGTIIGKTLVDRKLIENESAPPLVH